jgi:ABC transporter transmembrane region/Haemolysin-type calcium binding protein related domain/Peptidase C39 family
VTGAQVHRSGPGVSPVAATGEQTESIAAAAGEQVPPGAEPLPLALRALCLIARLHHVAAEPVALAHQLGWAPSHVPSTQDLLLAARQLGLKAKLSRSSAERLTLVALPALALVADDAGAQRVVVLAQCDGQRVLFQDPSEAIQGGRPVIEPVAAFVARWTGELILVTSRASLAGALTRFDFSWFIPSLVKYRDLFGEVLVVSLFLQLFALVSPLFFQVVMDKVLVHRGLTTLDVLVIGLTVVVLFESVLTILRTYVFSHTTSRIDVELGARLFRHLVNLPLAYFQARRVGDSVARVRELENIRSFLTGNALTLVLDVAFSVIFIGVMCMYSVPLTLIVLVSLPLYVGLSLLVVPVLRARLNEKFARGAENQALLVESVTGIQTVRANALEPALTRRWDNQLAAYLFGRGSGADTIDSLDATFGKLDTLQLAAGVATTEVALTRLVDDLVVSIVGTSDSIRARKHFVGNSTSGRQIDAIRFNDGISWSVADIRGKVGTVQSVHSILATDAITFASAGDVASPRFGFDDPLPWQPWYGGTPLAPESDPTVDVALRTQTAGLIEAMASFSSPTATPADFVPAHSMHSLPVIASPLAA